MCLCSSHEDTCHVGKAHPSDLILTTSAKAPFPNKVAFGHARAQALNIPSGGHSSTHKRFPQLASLCPPHCRASPAPRSGCKAPSALPQLWPCQHPAVSLETAPHGQARPCFPTVHIVLAAPRAASRMASPTPRTSRQARLPSSCHLHSGVWLPALAAAPPLWLSLGCSYQAGLHAPGRPEPNPQTDRGSLTVPGSPPDTEQLHTPGSCTMSCVLVLKLLEGAAARPTGAGVPGSDLGGRGAEQASPPVPSRSTWKPQGGRDLHCSPQLSHK